jgi:hypothetical protein
MRPSNILPACFFALLSTLPSASPHTPEHGSPNAKTPLLISTTTLSPQFFHKYYSQRVKATYGPYTVPSMHTNNGMISFGGATVPTPCTSCLLTYLHAGLEYADGTTADAHNGMWLHHTVWVNLRRNDSTCPGPKRGDRFFASGNERTPVDLTVAGTVKAGYEVRDGDVIAMGGELMNMQSEEREVRLTMVFEFIPTVPKKFKKVKGYWLDVGGCGSSDVEAKEDQAFEYSSPKFRSEELGSVVFTASHLHDGGTHAEIRKQGKVVCDSEAAYGKEGDERHIEALSACTDVGRTKPGDEWSITAYYNTSLHAPMRNMDGSLEPVMGISLVYVAVDGMSGGHKKLKIVLGVGVAVLSAVLVMMWANLNERDWLLRKREGVVLGEDTKSRWSLLGERYRDDV